MTAWDRSLFARAAAIAALALAVAMLVVIATDEGGPCALRVGMLAALAPVAGALGAASTTRLAAARGEVAALAAVGVGPSRAARGAALGGALVGALGPALASFGVGDLGALFPRPSAPHRWVADAEGLHEVTLGIHVRAGGLLEVALPAPGASSGLVPGAAPHALAALFAAAIAGPLWLAATEGGPPWRRAMVASLTVIAAIGAFQLVAAGRAPPAILLAAPVLLVLDAVASRYRARST